MQAEGKYATIHYQNYLGLDKILNAQTLRSEADGKPAHEEMLFIVTHQVYELWFKQILHELSSVIGMFRADEVDERNLGTAIGRLGRVEVIMQLLIDQIEVMESMTPLDFLDFRDYLFPASGFQSFQFRAVECMLGLPEDKRITYHGQEYSKVFSAQQQNELKTIYEHGTLFDCVVRWLERIPFLRIEGFDFVANYRSALHSMLERETSSINSSAYLSENEIQKRLEMLGNSETYFKSILNKEFWDNLVSQGNKRLSYDAALAALFINLYREEPILQLPFQLLNSLIKIDDLMTTWRYRHAQMVLRMLGNKVGTGGSSGHSYLSETAKQHKIFEDFHAISTLLIPRSALPVLPEKVKEKLGFQFSTL